MTNVNEKMLLHIQKIELLYNQMLDLSLQQRQFVDARRWEESGMDGFNRLLVERQSLMDQIDQIAIQEDGRTNPPRVDPANSSQLGIVVLAWQEHQERCRSIIQQIQVNDSVCRGALEKGADQVASNLAKTRSSKKASQAYSQPGLEQAWFFDKRK